MNNDLNEFERMARARLHSELGRVPVPAGRTSRARPGSAARWGARLAGGSAALAMLLLVAMVVAGGLRVAPETTQAPQTAASSPAERIILLSTKGSVAIVRAVDPATHQVLWEREVQDQAAAASPSALPTPAWIDGAISPDGSRVFVATRAGLAAYDAATGQAIWEKDAASADQIAMRTPDWPSTLAVSADGQRVYVQKERTASNQAWRWLDVLDAASGKVGAGIQLPEYDGMGQVFALDDQIYYVTSGQVYRAGPRGQSFTESRAIDVPLGVRAAGPAGDGRSIYVSNGEMLLNIDRDGLTAPLPEKYRSENGLPVFPDLPSFELDGTGTGDTYVITGNFRLVNPRIVDPLALSPDGKTAAVWVDALWISGRRTTSPRLDLYDVASWKPGAAITDPGASEAEWLRGDTLRFNPAGTAIYAIAGPRGHAGGDSALLRLNIAGGSATRLIELPGETVAALLMAAPPPAAPAVARPPAEAPPIEAPPAEVPSRLSLADLEKIRRIPAAGQPLVPSGEIGWVLQNRELLAWDRDGAATRPVSDSAIAEFRWAVPRLGRRPLLLVSLNDGRDAALDPETMAITPLDMPGRSLKPPFFLSPDDAQLVFKRSSPGQTDELAQADLATGAVWTLIDGAALGDNWTWLADGTLAGWGADGIYVDIESPAGHSLLRIQPRAGAAGAQPQFETLLRMDDGGWLSLSPATGLVAYRRIGDPALHLLDTRSGQEQPAAMIDNGFFSLSPDGGQLAYVQPDPGNTYSLRISSLTNQSVRAAAVGLGSEYSLYFKVSWSADGRYVILLSGPGPTQVQVFDTRTMVYDPDQPFAVVARYSLPGSVADVAVQQVEVVGGTVINVVTLSNAGDGVVLDVYNPVTSTRQTFDLGPDPADLADVP
ncbi:MAG TPA: hypothetical protein VD886_05300 [Herpetosiphonaceae bacterium]|nr:hypothetical protein [Herpetosiphonaceae bacterium]